jgi:ferredoxin
MSVPAGPSARLRVDPVACTGHGLCAEVFPERITLDDWGYPIIDGRDIPAQLLDHARRAAAVCPKLALLLAEPAGDAPAAGKALPKLGRRVAGG